MSNLINGEGQRQVPVLGVAWDAETQTVQFVFDNQQFRKWEFVIGLLEMAKKEAEHRLAMWRLQQMQQAQLNAQQEEAIRKTLRR